MRRFLITSEKFEGHVELLYNDANMLKKIDFINSGLSGQKTLIIKEKTPVNADFISIAFNELPLIIVEATIEVNFDMFWDKYNRKLNRKRSETIWGKLNKTNQVRAYYGIDAYDKYLKKESWRNKADPDTYLRNEYWKNEYR